MALWLQTASLLVLLALLWPSPSQAAPAPREELLCGSNLVDALQFVCEDRGFSFYPRRTVDPVLGSPSPRTGGENQTQGRGIVEQCCFNPCSLFDIEKYCN